MPVEKQHTGTYRQVAHKLRIQKDPGCGPHKESVRPRKGKRGPYLDSDDEPTLITFDEDDAVDVERLLAIGAIKPYSPPKPKRATKTKGADDGKAGV